MLIMRMELIDAWQFRVCVVICSELEIPLQLEIFEERNRKREFSDDKLRLYRSWVAREIQNRRAESVSDQE